MLFMTRYKRPEPIFEEGGGDLMVETAGYIPPKRQIEQFMLAGKRLELSRREMFDFPDGKEVEFSDPTRSPNFDMADATMLANPAMQRVRDGIKKVQEDRKKKKLDELKEFEEFKNSKNSKKKEEEPSGEEGKK